jgi:hypothetical protein
VTKATKRTTMPSWFKPAVRTRMALPKRKVCDQRRAIRLHRVELRYECESDRCAAGCAPDWRSFYRDRKLIRAFAGADHWRW